MRIPPELCARCKGYKLLCGLPRCPILARLQSQAMSLSRLREGRHLEGSTPPSALVGERGYPSVRVHFLVPPSVWGEEASRYEDPAGWAERGVPLDVILKLRSGLVAATVRVDARRPHESLYQSEVGLASLSQAPVDSEASLARPPSPRLTFNGYTKPLGPAAPAERIRVTGNPSLHRRLEKALWDDVKAETAVRELVESGVDVYTIQRALSLGFLGRLKSRRLVPTRWAITAVDEILSRHWRSKLRDAPWLDRVEVYQASYLGNVFTVILLPGAGRLEWIEAWHPKGLWTGAAKRVVYWRVEEGPLGDKTGEDGGFSAAKEEVLRFLASRGRRADAVILREILPSYYAPVGNWHIRESVRIALARGPILVDPGRGELEEAVGRAHRVPPSELVGRARLLKPRTTLEDFM